MGQAFLNIRMEEAVKAEFEAFCDEIGVTMSSLIYMFVKQALREQKVPFEISLNPKKETRGTKKKDVTVKE